MYLRVLLILALLPGFHSNAVAATNQTINVGSSNNFPPVNLLDDNGELTGFARTLSEAVLREANLTPQYQHSSLWTDILDKFKEHEIDLIHDSAWSLERDKFMDFSDPILEMQESIFVTPSRFDINDFDSLSGKTVACVNKHITHLYLQKFPSIKCQIVTDPTQGIIALLNGRVDAFIYPEPIALYLLQHLGISDKIKKTGLPVRNLKWSITVHEGNTALLNKINEGLRKVRASGEYDRIYRQWIGTIIERGYERRELINIASGIIAVCIAILFIGLFIYTRRLKIARDELQESHLRFSQLTDNIREIFWISSTDWSRIYYVSPAYELIWRKSCASLYKDPHQWQQSIHPDDAQAVKNAMNNFDPDDSEGLELPDYRIIRDDESIRWISSKVYPVRDKPGNVQRLVGVAEDVTRERETAMALHISNRTLETLSRTGRALIRAQHENQLLKDICELLITSGDYELAVVGFSDPSTASIKIIAWEAKNRLLISEKTLSEELNHNRHPAYDAIKTGTTQIRPRAYTQRSVYRPAYDRDSIALPIRYQEKTIGVLCIYSRTEDAFSPQEIELLKELTDDLSYGISSLRTTNALTNTRSQLQGLHDSIPDVLYRFDENQQLVSWNQKLSDITRYSDEELTNKSITDFFPVEEHNQVLEKFEEALTNGRSATELQLIAKDGTRIPFLFRNRPLFDENNIVQGITGIGRDLTREIQFEQEREHYQFQLQQAQKMEAVGQLTGGIAHDFNNILSIIMGYIGLIQSIDTKLSDETRSYLDEVYRASNRARDLIAQLLMFSRSDTTENEIFHITPLVKEVIKMIRATLPSNIEISILAEGDTLPIEGNPIQLHQCLTNLCINARDAISGNGKIIVRTRNQHREGLCSSCHEKFEGEYVLLSVKDNGEGIPTDILNNIFEPFFTTKPQGKGTGMGLAMLHGIIHKLGGHIVVTSNTSGSTFELLIPALQHPVSRKSASNDSSLTDIRNKRRSQHILLVDDEESITGFLSDFLGSKGYKTTSFNHSREAWNYFQQHPDEIDTIITDQTMPHMTGKTLAEKILGLRPDKKLILCTGFSSEINQAEAKSLGLYAFISKPIDNEKLIQALEETQQEPSREKEAQA